MISNRQTHFLFFTLLCLAAPLLQTCGFAPSNLVTVKLRLAGTRAGSSISDFQCLAVNVIGQNLPTIDEGFPLPPLAGMVAGDYCTYPGAGSPLLSITAPTANQTVVLRVPAGPTRIIQVLGIQTALGCTSQNVAEILRDIRRNNGTAATDYTGVVEIGRALMDFPVGMTDAAVTISNSYDSANPKSLLTCDSFTGTYITPRNAGMYSQDTLQLSVPSQFGAATFAVASHNCGGTVTLANGALTAATSAAQAFCTVTVQATIGTTTRNRDVYVYDPNATAAGHFKPRLWLRANSMATTPTSNGFFTASQLWTNVGTNTQPVFSPFTASANAMKYVFPTAGANNQASIQFSTGGGNPIMEGTGSSQTGGGDARMYVVARNGKLGDESFVCLADDTTNGCNSSAQSFFHLEYVASNTSYKASLKSQSVTLVNALIPDPNPGSSPFRIFRIVWKNTVGVNQQIKLAMSGANETSNTTNAGVIPPINPFVVIGAEKKSGQSPSKKLTGNIAEVLLYLDDIGTIQDLEILNYLRKKYDLPIL